MNNNYEPHTALLDDSIEVTEDLRKATKRVFDVVIEYNRKSNRTNEDTEWLNTLVDDFNYDQKYQAVRVKCSTPTELLEQYMQRRIVPQIRVDPHSSNRLYGIVFYTHYLDFQDFYGANKPAFPNYHGFCQVLSSFLHNLHAEITRSENHNDFFPYRPNRIIRDELWWKEIENQNQYAEHFISLEWHSSLDVSSVTGKSKLNDIFTTILTTYFPGFQYNHFPRHVWNRIFDYIANGQTLRTTMDYILRLAWWQVHKKPGTALNAQTDNNCKNSIKRHIAWCQYEHKRNCTLLHFECHSSENCPFYQESPSKKKNVSVKTNRVF